MADTLISSSECAWSKTSCTVLARKFVGLRGFEAKVAIDKEHLFASGGKPVDIVEGNETPTGSLTLLKYEVDLMNDAARAAGFESILHVPHTLISGVFQFKKDTTSKIRTIAITGIAFTELPQGMKQGDKMMEVTMPFLAMGIESL